MTASAREAAIPPSKWDRQQSPNAGRSRWIACNLEGIAGFRSPLDALNKANLANWASDRIHLDKG